MCSFRLSWVKAAPDQHPQATSPVILAEIDILGGPETKRVVIALTADYDNWSTKFTLRITDGGYRNLPKHYNALPKYEAEKLGITGMNKVPKLAEAARKAVTDLRTLHFLPDYQPTELMKDMISSRYETSDRLTLEFENLTITNQTYYGTITYAMQADGTFHINTLRYGVGYSVAVDPSRGFKNNREHFSMTGAGERELAEYLLPVAVAFWEKNKSARNTLRIAELRKSIEWDAGRIAEASHTLRTASQTLDAAEKELAQLTRESK
jgi:hypothetical protein